jgi:hypothetical protein
MVVTGALILAVLFPAGSASADPFVAVKDGQVVCDIVMAPGAEKSEPGMFNRSLTEQLPKLLERMTGVRWPIRDAPGERPAIVIALAGRYPDVAAAAGFTSAQPDAFCIVSTPDRLYILGRTPNGCRFGTMTLLHEFGARFFSPSPRWWILPKRRDLVVDLKRCDEPAVHSRTLSEQGDLTYALYDQYNLWIEGNRAVAGKDPQLSCGGSLTYFVKAHEKVFAEHPEYFAMLPDGTRDAEQLWTRRKLCYANEDMLKLSEDYWVKVTREARAKYPGVRYVVINMSGGYGTCHCPNCAKLGTPTDRVMHLVNRVARALQEHVPGMMVSIYATESHLLPPTVAVEPNVNVQLELANSRVRCTQSELLEQWSAKTKSLGIRESYSLTMWDWGLPGRTRGGRVAVFRKWLPRYHDKHVENLLGKFHAQWGDMTPGLYVGANLMWDPKADAEVLRDEFLALCFVKGQDAMRRLYDRFDLVPPLTSYDLLAMMRDVEEAYGKAVGADERGRVVDMMMYLQFATLFRDLALERDLTFPVRGDAYYAALRPLMEFTFDHLHRDMQHHYQLGLNGLCGRMAVQDNRMEFAMDGGRRGGSPVVWRRGKPYEHTKKRAFDDPFFASAIPNDAEVIRVFRESLKRMETQADYRAVYSPILAWVTVREGVAGADDGEAQTAELHLRGGLNGWVSTDGTAKSRMTLAPASPPCQATVSYEDASVVKAAYWLPEMTTVITSRFEKMTEQVWEVTTPPRAADYRIAFTGDLRLGIPRETPLVVEASWARPLVLGKSGPLYFYVPKGNRELVFGCKGMISLSIPGEASPRVFTENGCVKGKNYVVLNIPAGAAGQVWRLNAGSEGNFALYNAPAYLTPFRDQLVAPIDIAMVEDLDIGWSRTVWTGKQAVGDRQPPSMDPEAKQ